MDKEKKKIYNKKYREKNREKLNLYDKEYKKKNKEKVSLNHKKYKEANFDRIKEYNLKYQKEKRYEKKLKRDSEEGRNKYLLKNFNITLEDYNILFYEQKCSCAICGIHQDKLYRRMAVDHNHITGDIRGLLCDNCNRGIGLLKENIEVLKKSIIYLETRNENPRCKRR